VEVDDAIANESHDKAMEELQRGNVEQARNTLLTCFCFSKHDCKVMAVYWTTAELTCMNGTAIEVENFVVFTYYQLLLLQPLTTEDHQKS
jgi:hypothetical protein